MSHPDFETLLAFHHGEMDTRQSARIRKHIEDCLTCRTEYATMAAEWASFRAAAGEDVELEPLLRDTLPQILASIGEWKRSGVSGPGAEAQLHAKVAEQLSLYLGSHAPAMVDRILREKAGGIGLLGKLESMLATLLGGRAARAVSTRIIEELELGRRRQE